jgi:hypothetical protein
MKGGGGIKPFFHDLKRVHWPLNFKLSGIENYDGSTNLAEWLEVYRLAIETVEGDSYVMANYMPTLPIIICKDMAHGASHRVGSLLVQLVLIVHQHLLGHMRVTRSRLGPSQRGTEEGVVPSGVYPTLLQ